MRDGEYLADIHCYNCGTNDKYWVPEGVEVEEYVKDRKCKNCKCIKLG